LRHGDSGVDGSAQYRAPPQTAEYSKEVGIFGSTESFNDRDSSKRGPFVIESQELAIGDHSMRDLNDGPDHTRSGWIV
jgi:hypothetical protein